MTQNLKSLVLILLLALAPEKLSATDLKPLVLKSEDDQDITGYIYENPKTPDTAPVAILFHGMTRSSLDWLADGFPTYGGKFSKLLLSKGFRILAIDARAHGYRQGPVSAYDTIKSLRKGDKGPYQSMVQLSVADYKAVLAYASANYPNAKSTLLAGYSMGAQMAMIVTAGTPQITHLITMVPPYVGEVPSVSPLTHAPSIKAPWLLLTANSDRFSTIEQNRHLADEAISVSHVTFDSDHALPETYLESVNQWLTRDFPDFEKN